jgi:hemolysin D
LVHFGSSLSIASPSLTAVALPTAPAARRLRPVDGVAFLPAALEIVETPPSPIGRAIALTVIAAFCAALAWASLGKVDIIAAAQGKIIPSGRSKIVQPFEIGAVRAIHVKDGQTVKAGDVLIELDPTISDAELRHLRSDLVAAQLDVARQNRGDDPHAGGTGRHPRISDGAGETGSKVVYLEN